MEGRDDSGAGALNAMEKADQSDKCMPKSVSQTKGTLQSSTNAPQIR